MGRTPIPDEEKERRGTLEKSRVNKDKPILEKTEESPQVPITLTGAAIEVWDKTVPELWNIGLVDTVGESIIESYCRQMGRHLDIEREISSASDFIQKTENGYEQINALFTLSNKALDQALKIAREYGLTPSSRTRIGLEWIKIKEKDGFFQ